MSIDNMLHYFSSRKYFVGSVKSKRFKRFIYKTENKPGGLNAPHAFTEKVIQEQKTTCYAFLYDELNIEVEMLKTNEHDFEAEMAKTLENSEIPFN